MPTRPPGYTRISLRLFARRMLANPGATRSAKRALAHQHGAETRLAASRCSAGLCPIHLYALKILQFQPRQHVGTKVDYGNRDAGSYTQGQFDTRNNCGSATSANTRRGWELMFHSLRLCHEVRGRARDTSLGVPLTPPDLRNRAKPGFATGD